MKLKFRAEAKDIVLFIIFAIRDSNSNIIKTIFHNRSKGLNTCYFSILKFFYSRVINLNI